MRKVFKDRIKECQRRMGEVNAEMMILSPGPNIKYFTGIDAEVGERHFLLFVPREEEPIVLIPEVEKQKVDDIGIDAEVWSDFEDPRKYLKDIMTRLGMGKDRVLLDDLMPERFSYDIRESFNAKYGLASEIVKEMRMIKDKDEIENIREASEIADKVIEDVRNKDVVGMTENELKQFIEKKMNYYGGDGRSFSTVVASGPNSANPHHRGSDKEIKSGEPVILDFGCLKNGYPSDQTRTLVFGKDEPSERFKEVFELVEKAQDAAVKAVRPGVKSDEIDEVAREIIEEAGYGDEFVHRTGHGVGLEIHEYPKLPPIVDAPSELKSSMVFSVEPGIYIEGEFGVRIEDLVKVTESGCRRLNKSAKSWKTEG